MKFAHFGHVWGKAGMTPAQRYAQLWRELQLCDELGFEYAFCVEHHFSPHESWMSAPSLFTVGAGARTKRLRLGGMGYVVPLYHPVRLAEEIALADQMLDGRLEIGLVSGVSPRMFGPFGADFAKRRQPTLDFVKTLKSVFPAGEVNGTGLAVGPVQKPHPPIWLETRDPETLKFCAEQGLHTGYFMVYSRKETAAKYRAYLDQWKRAGNKGKPNIAYSTVIYVDETDEKAMQNGLKDAAAAYRGFFPPTDDAAQLRKFQDESARRYDQVGDEFAAAAIRGLLDPDHLLATDMIVIGSPDTVAKKLKELAVEGLFNTYLGEFNFGNLPEENVMRSIRLFGTEVMPRLRRFEPF
jgi:alkanesulfonate monooxygenase SsuD/methylene tetrahydromethanopterin reductase-like flavin-dependent oxidoreductase (luciferase family)